MFEFKEIKSETEYKLLELNPDAPFTQAWFFGEWQKMIGRKVRRFEIRNNVEIFGFFQIIIYPLVFSNNFIYIPHGPILMRNPSEEFLKKFKEEIMRIVKEENAIFARFDIHSHNPNYGSKEDLDRYFKKTPIVNYHSSHFQPKYEWILNIEKSEEELLNSMHSKTRYNIGLAERRGIKIEIVSENFDKYFYDFYRLLEETARRDNFNLHTKDYYQNIFKIINHGNAFLSVAKYDDKILAINLILLFGNIAYFMHGGSSDEHKNLMFSYLAQWEAIKEAKKRGFEVYNFGGVQGSGDGYKNYESVSFFKKRFGGKLFEYIDSYDIVLKPCWYYLYNLRKWLLNQK